MRSKSILDKRGLIPLRKFFNALQSIFALSIGYIYYVRVGYATRMPLWTSNARKRAFNPECETTPADLVGITGEIYSNEVARSLDILQ